MRADIGSPPTTADLNALTTLGIDADLLHRCVRRVTNHEAREDCGIRYRSERLEGLAFWYFDPRQPDNSILTCRVRRDRPEREADGKAIHKYLGPWDRHHLFFPPGAAPLLAATTVPVVIVEAEKSVLTLMSVAARLGRSLLAIGTGGDWGWRGTIGIDTGPNGSRDPVKGSLTDFAWVDWTDRPVVILFDSNAAENFMVQAGRRALAKELTRRGARVRIGTVPAEPGVNGPDDYRGAHDDAALFALIESATPFQPDHGLCLTVTVNEMFFEAANITIERGVVRAIVTAFDARQVWHRDGPLSLTSAQRRRQFLHHLEEQRGQALATDVDPLLEIESLVRDQERHKPPPATGPTADPRSPPPPELTTEAARIATKVPLLRALRSVGWVGDLRAPVLPFLALLSRLLARPINLAYVSPPASGKNKAVDTAGELTPPEAMYIVRAGSARALIFAPESFEHRVVIFTEGDSIPEDGPAASAIRSLASDNVLAYDVVERNPETEQFETRRIEKPGPTGLITTSTVSLRQQLGTRVLEVAVADNEPQTRLILQHQARAVSPHPAAAFDTTPWLAFQRHLAANGPYRIVIPYANALSALVPAKAARMRRDFPQLLTCIQALALLASQHRDRTADGAIVATFADYRRARWVLKPVFDSLGAGGCTKAIRETVDAVPEGKEVTQAYLGKTLKLEKTAVFYRVNKALTNDWLKNLETRPNHPARLVRGEPLPDAVEALPTPDALRKKVEALRRQAEGSGGVQYGVQYGSFSTKPEDSTTYPLGFSGSNQIRKIYSDAQCAPPSSGGSTERDLSAPTGHPAGHDAASEPRETVEVEDDDRA